MYCHGCPLCGQHPLAPYIPYGLDASADKRDTLNPAAWQLNCNFRDMKKKGLNVQKNDERH